MCGMPRDISIYIGDFAIKIENQAWNKLLSWTIVVLTGSQLMNILAIFK